MSQIRIAKLKIYNMRMNNYQKLLPTAKAINNLSNLKIKFNNWNHNID